MPSAVRAIDRGSIRGERALAEAGAEFREKRLAIGASQETVAAAAKVSRPRYSRIEHGSAKSLSLMEVHRIAAVLGLDAVLRLYPGGIGIRDAGQAERLARLIRHVHPPLRCRTEVPLPSLPGRLELRAWDAMLTGHGTRTAIEVEMRLRDIQACGRRVALKRRDDPTEHFLLVVADTRANRRVLDLLVELLPDLPRLRTRDVLAALQAGRHPGSGMVLL